MSHTQEPHLELITIIEEYTGQTGIFAKFADTNKVKGPDIEAMRREANNPSASSIFNGVVRREGVIVLSDKQLKERIKQMQDAGRGDAHNTKVLETALGAIERKQATGTTPVPATVHAV